MVDALLVYSHGWFYLFDTDLNLFDTRRCLQGGQANLLDILKIHVSKAKIVDWF